MFCMLQCAACWNYRPGRGFLNVVQLQHHHHYTVGWSDLALYCDFQKWTNPLYFYWFFSKKIAKFFEILQIPFFYIKEQSPIRNLEFLLIC